MEKVSMTMVSNLLTRVPPLFSDLAKILAGEIDCSVTTLTKYATDGSPYFILPQAVIYPKNTTDIKHVLSFAREYTIPVTVRGSGSATTGGALGEGIILDMKRYFSQIRTVNMMENTVTVDAGVMLHSLLEKLHAWHFDIPLLSMNNTSTTVGALLATKSASESSFHHGTIREWVEGLTVVVDSGEEHHIADGITPSGRLLGIYQSVFPLLTQEGPTLRAAKPISHDDASGYNLWNTSIGPRQLIDQLVGSEGTLGIITSVTFRISPHKPHHITTCIPVTSLKLLPSYIEIAKHHKAESIFMYDQAFMQLADKYYPTLVPFFPDTPCTLLVTHAALDKEKLHQTLRTFRHALPVEEHFLKKIDDEHSVNKITNPDFVHDLTNAYTNNTLTQYGVADGLIVTIPQVPAFLTELEDYLNSLGNLYVITGNVGSGHLSVITLFDPRSRNYDNDTISYSKKIFSLLKKYNGGISTVQGEGLIRAPYLSYVYSDAALAVFKKIKDIWDPLSILNPGKKFGVTTTYLQQHTKRPAREKE
jgi:FAD/FMN-containing dehydrogenase